MSSGLVYNPTGDPVDLASLANGSGLLFGADGSFPSDELPDGLREQVERHVGRCRLRLASVRLRPDCDGSVVEVGA